MVGRASSTNGPLASRLSTMARLLSMRPLRKASTAGSPGGLASVAQEAIGAEKAVDLLVVEDDPAQRLEALVLAFRLELARALGEVGEDHGRLAERARAVHEHRHFAHFVDVAAVFRRARLALGEEVDPDRLPVGADEVEHQRGAIGVARLSEAVELVLGHCVSPA